MTSIMGFYIPYNRLHEILEENFKNVENSYTKCNFIIDLSSCINTIYYNKFNINNKNLSIDILENIINMISHYKFGLRKYKLDIKFIFIYSENNPTTSLNFYNYYNVNSKIMKSNLPTINDHVEVSLKYFKKIWKFLYNVLYIESDFDSTHIVNKIIKESDEDIINIVLSKDPVMYQNINKDNIILRPYKDSRTKTDSSYIINNNNKFDIMISKVYQIKNEFDIKFDKNECNIISLLMTLSGIKQRSYNKTFKISESIKIFNEYTSLYNTDKISPIELFNSMNTESLSIDLFNKWKAIDSEYQYNLINDIFIYDVSPLIDREFLDNLNKNIFNNKVKFDEISN